MDTRALDRMTACIWLSYAANDRLLAPRVLCALQQQVPDPTARFRILTAPGDPRRSNTLSDPGLRRRARETALRALRDGVTCLTPDQPGYPRRLRGISGRPACLFCVGDPEYVLNTTDPVVAVVGSRRLTPYARHVTRHVTRALSEAGCTVVSGLARGVDGLAHETALAYGGRTAAVVAGGIDHVYPPEHRLLRERICRDGVLLSEHAPGIRPHRGYFPARNRILSGLADAVVVTAAAERSGTLITAGFAADQGRELIAVPGPVFHEQSRGCHRLIQDGAAVFTGTEDLLRLLRELTSRSGTGF